MLFLNYESVHELWQSQEQFNMVYQKNTIYDLLCLG